jgi:hypothetical protein
LGRVGQGNGRVEVCSGNRSKSQDQRDEGCTCGKGVGQQSHGHILSSQALAHDPGAYYRREQQGCPGRFGYGAS